MYKKWGKQWNKEKINSNKRQQMALRSLQNHCKNANDNNYKMNQVIYTNHVIIKDLISIIMIATVMINIHVSINHSNRNAD